MIEVKAGIDYFGLKLDEYPDSCFSSPPFLRKQESGTRTAK